jgi:dTDP-4-dehydrorhamnose 3,5-epimerase
MEYEFIHSSIPDVVYIRKKFFSDIRGTLIKEYETTPFSELIKVGFLEEYISISKRNVLRGLHYQKNPKPQGKLISVIDGEILDVAVDVREGSPHYLKYVSKRLNGESNESIWIPPGFAHGFLSLTENSVVLNRCTNEFDQSLEGGVRWDDPAINIQWPLSDPILSDKDSKWKFL